MRSIKCLIHRQVHPATVQPPVICTTQLRHCCIAAQLAAGTGTADQGAAVREPHEILADQIVELATKRYWMVWS